MIIQPSMERTAVALVAVCMSDIFALERLLPVSFCWEGETGSSSSISSAIFRGVVGMLFLEGSVLGGRLNANEGLNVFWSDETSRRET